MITRDNYEMFFLLYLDNELSPADRIVVERFVIQNPDLQEQLESLQQTVLLPDTSIAFPSKETLYKKRSSFLFMPVRMAAAALIGAIVLLLFFINRRTTTHGSPVHDQSLAIAPTTRTIPSHPTLPPATANTTPVITAPAIKKDAPAVTSSIASTSNKQSRQEKHPSLLQQQKTNNTLSVNEDRTSIARDDQEEQKLADRVSIQGAVIPSRTTSPITAGTLNSVAYTAQPADSSTALSEEDLTGEASPRKKNKLRGLFRRVTRVLDKTVNRDEEGHRSVLIGGFQFALK